MAKLIDEEEVLAANIRLSAAMAAEYKKNEPHYNLENIKVVDTKLRQLKRATKGESLLDLGCGTGFIIDIAQKYFDYIWGIDISEEMLHEIDVGKYHGSVCLEVGTTDKTPFKDKCFDVVTAYALLHHLHDIGPTLKEAQRVLKKDGIFYSALDPNFYFFEALNNMRKEGIISEIVARELRKVKEEKANKLHVAAEPLKYLVGGFDEEYLAEELFKAGFDHWRIDYYWLLGEGFLIHNEVSKRHSEAIKGYVKSLLPLSRHLFKYVEILAVK